MGGRGAGGGLPKQDANLRSHKGKPEDPWGRKDSLADPWTGPWQTGPRVCGTSGRQGGHALQEQKSPTHSLEIALNRNMARDSE